MQGERVFLNNVDTGGAVKCFLLGAGMINCPITVGVATGPFILVFIC